MEFKFIDVERAANILGVTTRTITKMIIVGRINAEAEYGGGGRGGISYRIPLDALPADTQLALLRACREVARLTGIADSGYRIASNCGADASQSVQHLHIHVLGGGKLSVSMA